MSQSMSRDELRGAEEAGREGGGREGEGRALTIKDSLPLQAWVGWRKAGQGRRERRVRAETREDSSDTVTGNRRREGWSLLKVAPPWRP
jgi:hypothetical protein